MYRLTLTPLPTLALALKKCGVATWTTTVIDTCAFPLDAADPCELSLDENYSSSPCKRSLAGPPGGIECEV